MNNTINEVQIARVIQKTGWSRERVIESMQSALARTGITYEEYIKYGFYGIPEERHGEKFRAILKAAEKKRIQIAEKYAMYVTKVAMKTGVSYEVAEERIKEAKRRTGCTAEEYYVHRFYELEPSVQETVFFRHISRKIRRKYNTNQKSVVIAEDKALADAALEKYLKRAWCVNTEISKEEFVEKFKDSKRIIYKPTNASGGRGVEAYEIDSRNAKQVYDSVSRLPKGVVEEFIVQHPEMNKLCSSSVNTLRILTISSLSGPVTPDGKQFDVAYASVRVGGGTACVDNYHAGGMQAMIDLETGIINTAAINMEGEMFEVHPLTGATIRGHRIPLFEEAIQMIRQMCEEGPLEGYIGWDIAIGVNGPQLVEANHFPGSMGLSRLYIAENKSMRSLMEKYL